MDIGYVDTLHTLAQIAIALIGFSGIVVVFGERTSARWTAEEALRLYALLAPSLTVLFCCFIPILLAALLDRPETVWRIANALLGLAHGANLAGFLINTWKAKITTSQKSLAVFGGLVVASHFFAAFNLLPLLEFIFIFGLLQQLFIGVHNFLLLFKDNVSADT